MKNFLSMLSRPTREAAPQPETQEKPVTTAAPATTPIPDPLIGRRHSDAEVAEFTANQATQVVGAALMVKEAATHKEGSAIKAFVPVFLQQVFGNKDELHVIARRGSEVLYFTNPTLESLGKLNSVGYLISVRVDEHDTSSALTFQVNKKVLELIEYPLYPSMILDLGDGSDEYLVVYRLTEILDRAQNHPLFRVKAVLEEVIGDALQGNPVPSETLPMAGFFLKGGKHAVRVVRYGKRYTLGQLIESFKASDELDRRWGRAPKPNAEQVVEGLSQDAIGDVLTPLTALGPLTMWVPTRLIQNVARRLLERGVDEETRLSLAPELHARLGFYEPDWTDAQGITVELITAIFRDPDDEALMTPPKPRKTRTRTT